MAKDFELAKLGQYLSVNTAANTAAMNTSTLSVTTINTANAATNLTVSNANTAANVVLYGNGMVSVANMMFVNATSVTVANAINGPNPSLGARSFFRVNDLEIAENLTIWDKSINITSIDLATEIITATGHVFTTNDVIQVSSTNTIPGGLTGNTNYYVVNAVANTFQISTTRGGSAVNITDAGNGTITVYKPVNVFVTGPVTLANGFTITIPAGSTVSGA